MMMSMMMMMTMMTAMTIMMGGSERGVINMIQKKESCGLFQFDFEEGFLRIYMYKGGLFLYYPC